MNIFTKNNPLKTKLWEQERRGELSESMGEHGSLEGVTNELFKDLLSFGDIIRSASLLRPRTIPVDEYREDSDLTAQNYIKELVIEVASNNKHGESQNVIGHRIPWGQGVTGRAAQSNRVCVCNDVSRAEEHEHHQVNGDQREGSEIAVPLFDNDGDLLGVVEAHSPKPYIFDTQLKGYITQQATTLGRHLIGIGKNEHCPLTGVYRDSVFGRIAKLEIKSALRKNKNLCFVELDLDHFKLVNDNVGHSEGDKVLHHFGDFLRTKSRLSDFIVRTGGDEFYIIMPYTNYEQAKQVVGRLREKTREIITLDYPALQEKLKTESPGLSFSYGVASLTNAINKRANCDRAEFPAVRTETVDQLFDILHKHADMQMYDMKAKR